MKHRIYNKLSRQFGKPLSKTIKSAVRNKAAGKAKAQPDATKALGRPAKQSTRKVAAKETMKEAEAAPATREVRAQRHWPQNPLRPHVGPRYVDPLDYPAHP